jgi:hypothetical protein
VVPSDYNRKPCIKQNRYASYDDKTIPLTRLDDPNREDTTLYRTFIMIDHISTYAIDYIATKRFYTAVLNVLGYGQQAEFVAEWETEFPNRRICGFGRDSKADFWIVETAVVYTPRHVAFSATQRRLVDEFHSVGLSHGGKDNGAPGLRPIYHEHYYGSFLIDPDGNDVEAVCHLAK